MTLRYLTELRKLERRAAKDRAICGGLSDDKERTLELCARSYEKLLGSTAALADALDQDLPDLPEEKAEMDAVGVELWSAGGAGEGSLGPWDDIETKSFYEDLADLLTAVPPSQVHTGMVVCQDCRNKPTLHDLPTHVSLGCRVSWQLLFGTGKCMESGT